jgi:hypothetical protein
MKKETALAIVDAWKRNCKVMEVPELRNYMDETKKFVPFKMNIRVMISEYNRLASSALWDGHFNRAAGLLMKHGLKDSSQVRKPELNETYIVSNRLSGDIRNPKSDWKYVK